MKEQISYHPTIIISSKEAICHSSTIATSYLSEIQPLLTLKTWKILEYLNLALLMKTLKISSNLIEIIIKSVLLRNRFLNLKLCSQMKLNPNLSLNQPRDQNSFQRVKKSWTLQLRKRLRRSFKNTKKRKNKPRMNAKLCHIQLLSSMFQFLRPPPVRKSRLSPRKRKRLRRTHIKPS